MNPISFPVRPPTFPSAFPSPFAAPASAGPAAALTLESPSVAFDWKLAAVSFAFEAASLAVSLALVDVDSNLLADRPVSLADWRKTAREETVNDIIADDVLARQKERYLRVWEEVVGSQWQSCRCRLDRLGKIVPSPKTTELCSTFLSGMSFCFDIRKHQAQRHTFFLTINSVFDLTISSQDDVMIYYRILTRVY